MTNSDGLSGSAQSLRQSPVLLAIRRRVWPLFVGHPRARLAGRKLSQRQAAQGEIRLRRPKLLV
jgi:hypothetical protein